MKGWSDFSTKLGTAVQAVSAVAVSSAQQIGKRLATEALGAQCLLDYAVGGQTACAGPGGLWKVYTARSKKEGSPHPVVSAWVLDKRVLTHTEEQLYGGSGGGGLTRPSARRLELLLEQCRHDVHALARLKHPCVLRLIAPLEETRTQLVFITEPVFASLADLMGGAGTVGSTAALPPALAQERRQLKLSELELKHGLLQVADGLHFLHSEAGLVHRGIAPTSILITQTGAWKLAGFAFSSPQDFQTPNQKPYDYSDPDPSLLQQVTQPCLQYVAPELVASGTSSITGAADVFSLGALAFELTTRRQLLPVGHSLADYESRVHSLTLVDMTGVPMGLEQPLRSMVAPIASARPPAAAFAGCQYFQSDVLLRALKFLDTMIQRDSLQKAAFLRDLPAMCAQLDSRVLRYKVLPPLLQELRDVQLQPTLLPIVLNIVQQQEPGEFADATLPALRPLLASASGETLLLLVQNAELLAKCMPAAAAAQVLPALFVRAAQHGDTRAQEEVLKRTAAMADKLDYEGLKKAVLPAVHALCLGTTSASVRVSSFAAMSRLVGRMDQAEAEAMLQTAVKVTAVDKSAPTAMCVLALGGSLAKQWGPRLAAERVLPTLAPLLVCPTLNTQQFGTAVKMVRDVVSQIEKGRAGGAAATDGGATLAGSAAAAAGAGAANGGLGGGVHSAASPAAADWMAATALGPVSSSSSGGGGGGGASSSPGGMGGSMGPRPAAPAAAAAAVGFGSADPLAGLQLQQQAAAAAAPSARPGAPAAAANAAGGSKFGLAGGQVGAGRPMGPLLSMGGSPGSGASAPSQPSWGFPGAAASAAINPGSTSSSPGGGGLGMGSSPWPGQQQKMGGAGGGMGPDGGMGPGSSSSRLGGSQAASLVDPFAGLQLGGGGSGGGGSSVQWPAPSSSSGGIRTSGAGSAAASTVPVFDPFALGSCSGTGGAGQWPVAAPQQQQHRQQQPGAPGGSLMDLL